MKKPDLPKFAVLMMSIGELYGKAISQPITELYWQILERFQWEDVEQALQAHLQNPDTGQYFPKPADVVRFIEGSGETKALQAWSKIEQAIHRVGRYQSLAFDDSMIHAVLEEMGGWVKLCATGLDEIPFRANEFQKRYMGFMLKKPNRYPRYLCGLAEGENAKNGYPFKPPLLVGDAKKVQQVMLGGGGEPLSIQESSQSISVLMQRLSHLKNEGDET